MSTPDANTLLMISQQRNKLWSLLVDIERACATCRASELRDRIAELASRRDEIVPGQKREKGEPAKDSPKVVTVELDPAVVTSLRRALSRAG